ncbi:MAG: hypothetical protein WBX15_09345 [Thermoanaerobaculia bacterium]
MLYQILLDLHSWNRWIVLALGLLAVVSAFGVSRHSEPRSLARRASLFFMMSVDIQLLLGVVLYVVTPWISAFFANPAAGMQDPTTRFWAIEHDFGMVVAIILVHIGNVMMKRGGSRKPAIMFAIALLIMIATIPWPFLPYGRPLLRL